MTSLPRTRTEPSAIASLPRPAAVLAAMIALVLLSQIAIGLGRPGALLGPPIHAVEPGVPGAELERSQADVAFWATRLEETPSDVVAATELASAQLERGRITGDLAAFLAAEAAADVALALVPDHLPAVALHGNVDIALHRFPEALTTGRQILGQRPSDPAGLALVADASLESGDLAAAHTALDRLASVDGGHASLIRSAHLAFIEGRTFAAVGLGRAAVAGAIDDGETGSAVAWYLVQLGDLLSATGDPEGSRAARAAAVLAAPDSWIAQAALARSLAAGGDLDGAIRHLDAATAVVPRIETLALRADLLERRGRPGDGDQARLDRGTIEAIATVARSSGSAIDRVYASYLADQGLQTRTAVALAWAEAAVRNDVYGLDALAWALLSDGRTQEALTASDAALGIGIRDPKVLYHAGMIAAAAGRSDLARERLTDALALDPAFDLRQADRARQTLSSLDGGDRS